MLFTAAILVLSIPTNAKMMKVKRSLPSTASIKAKSLSITITLLTVPMDEAGLGHLAFEVEDVNAVNMGHEYLKSKGYKHSWGIGRHYLGFANF